MATINAGRVRPYPRGAWSNSVKYNFFDLVTNGGSSYLCINTSGAPAGTALSNGTYWALLAEKGDTGPQGAAGPTGPTGAAGTAATITIGTVTTGAAGTNAVVTNVGTATAAKLNFTIPRGATGATGPQGPSGVYTGPLKPTTSYWTNAVFSATARAVTAPSGGTWACFRITITSSTSYYLTPTIVSGGGTLQANVVQSSAGDTVRKYYICWRIQ